MQIVEKTKRPAWRSPVFAGWFGKAAFAGSGPRTGIPAVASQDIRPCNGMVVIPGEYRRRAFAIPEGTANVGLGGNNGHGRIYG